MNIGQMFNYYADPVANKIPVSVRRPKKGNPKPNNKVANDAKMAQSKARYKAAMKGTWAATVVIEARMGFGRSTAYKSLEKYLARGWVERRPVGGGEFNKRSGWEWRWIE